MVLTQPIKSSFTSRVSITEWHLYNQSKVVLHPEALSQSGTCTTNQKQFYSQRLCHRLVLTQPIKSSFTSRGSITEWYLHNQSKVVLQPEALSQSGTYTTNQKLFYIHRFYCRVVKCMFGKQGQMCAVCGHTLKGAWPLHMIGAALR